jgi:hypothetical protein
MEERAEQAEQLVENLSPQSVADIVLQDHPISHRQLQRVRARFQTTNSVVVLAGLAVMLSTVISIVLYIVDWVVLT